MIQDRVSRVLHDLGRAFGGVSQVPLVTFGAALWGQRYNNGLDATNDELVGAAMAAMRLEWPDVELGDADATQVRTGLIGDGAPTLEEATRIHALRRTLEAGGDADAVLLCGVALGDIESHTDGRTFAALAALGLADACSGVSA